MYVGAGTVGFSSLETVITSNTMDFVETKKQMEKYERVQPHHSWN